MQEGRTQDIAQLGELEAAVMAVLWSRADADVHQVLDNLIWDKPLAYTTVMTVLNRLVRKGYVQREKHGRTFRYQALLRQDQAARSAMRQVVTRFFGGLRGRAVAELLSDRESLSEEDLAELEQMIQRQRQGREQ